MKKGPNKKRSILLDSGACYTRILILSAEQSGISMDFKTIDLTLITLEIHSKSRLFGSGASIVKHSIPAFIDIDLFDLYFLIKAMTSTLVWKALALASSAKDESPSGSQLTGPGRLISIRLKPMFDKFKIIVAQIFPEESVQFMECLAVFT